MPRTPHIPSTFSLRQNACAPSAFAAAASPLHLNAPTMITSPPVHIAPVQPDEDIPRTVHVPSTLPLCQNGRAASAFVAPAVALHFNAPPKIALPRVQIAAVRRTADMPRTPHIPSTFSLRQNARAPSAFAAAASPLHLNAPTMITSSPVHIAPVQPDEDIPRTVHVPSTPPWCQNGRAASAFVAPATPLHFNAPPKIALPRVQIAAVRRTVDIPRTPHIPSTFSLRRNARAPSAFAAAASRLHLNAPTMITSPPVHIAPVQPDEDIPRIVYVPSKLTMRQSSASLDHLAARPFCHCLASRGHFLDPPRPLQACQRPCWLWIVTGRGGCDISLPQQGTCHRVPASPPLCSPPTSICYPQLPRTPARAEMTMRPRRA
ncbi:hypothetical protein BD626DRAFT_22952 [Schizophyllum amplum]|uniref:Uncharacterized protein n=1 Tax=Schizophyllum amplum TaxID=97359 RepID=A0A550CZ52_9AGAR|nr:hypothetical protein BD626DRAFT_22952 [Auriculariopsis ampla]